MREGIPQPGCRAYDDGNIVEVHPLESVGESLAVDLKHGGIRDVQIEADLGSPAQPEVVENMACGPGGPLHGKVPHLVDILFPARHGVECRTYPGLQGIGIFLPSPSGDMSRNLGRQSLLELIDESQQTFGIEGRIHVIGITLDKLIAKAFILQQVSE